MLGFNIKSAISKLYIIYYDDREYLSSRLGLEVCRHIYNAMACFMNTVELLLLYNTMFTNSAAKIATLG